MRRRDVVRGALAVGAGGTLTVAGLHAATDAADAQASAALNVADDRVLLAEGGAIAAVWLDLSVEWAFVLPQGVQPATVTVSVAAGLDGDDSIPTVASSESAELFLEADGSEDFEVDLLAEEALSADALAPEAGARETDVRVVASLVVANADGGVLAEDQTESVSTLTVEREGFDATEYGSVSGSGELRIETE